SNISPVCALSPSLFNVLFPTCFRVLAMSSTDESIRYMGENPGEDPSEATSKRSGSNPPFYASGRRWSLRQAARRLLDESLEGEGDEEEADSSPGKIDPAHMEE
ncbi:UNVERIFIED_CONTAM: hypothetical protein Slati_0870400, partial [Sesamum latifolium]